MSVRSERTATVILGSLLSTLLSSLFCAVVWYQVDIHYPSSAFFGKNGAFVSGIVGLVLGGAGGAIIGLVVTVPRLAWLLAIPAGFIINGTIPMILFGSSDATSYAQRSLNYSALGQACVGGIVGLLISVLMKYLSVQKSRT